MYRYTTAQQAAINELERPLQLIACAGSGKTQVISQRISNVLRQPGVKPGNIVAFTFTEKAAAELNERIGSIVAAEHGGIIGMAEMYVGTMHGFCLDLVQTYIPEMFKFSVLSDITQRLLIDRTSRESGLTTCPVTSAQGNLRRYQDSRLYMQVLSILQEDAVDLSLVPESVKESLNSYKSMIVGRSYFDYTSMVATAVALLESDEDREIAPGAHSLLDHVKNEIKYVVVDEFQDVNPLQERLIAALVRFGANLCVVGDDDQTIYQWRGSDVQNILEFAGQHAHVRQIELSDNFRSSNGIVALGRSIAELIPPSERLEKGMVHASHQSWDRGDILALTFDDLQQEASWIADRVQALRGVPFVDTDDEPARGLSWSDCAVLFRTVKDAGPLVEEFRKRGIPFLIKGLAHLFETSEIIAVTGLFHYMVDQINKVELRQLWNAAELLPGPARFEDVIKLLDKAKLFDNGDRWGIYNIQRLYLDVLKELDLREATIPGTPERAELVMYQLGKFSQVISDFETIHFSSAPKSKYESFIGFLQYQAPGYYEESDEDAGYATPDAVTISTIHRAKGMQWPAVFVPCLRKNRFPAARVGGLNAFHVIPMEAVPNGERYRGTRSEETRLFYVAVTRAKKYLYATWAPGQNARSKKSSDFFAHCTRSSWVSTADGRVTARKIEPTPKVEIPAVTVTFSELKYLFECPYQFKLRFMYGFNPPIHEALGYGKGLHDALAEMHKRAISGDLPLRTEAGSLVKRHLRTPYAYPALREQLESSAVAAIERYFDAHGDDLTRTLHSEKQIRVQIDRGVVVEGRIDLVKSIETNEVSIVDFKSTERAQAEDVTRDQLHVYAVGYQDLTGENADLIEVLNLDQAGRNTRESVNEQLLRVIREKVVAVADSIRSNRLDCTHSRHLDDSGFDDLAWMCVPDYAGYGRK